ncbi:MAG TPA: L,D-transpeptidase [Polyangiaceae bacterium]|jgi:lipoprotein-anchoring transpeptidase ErfK/SrfK|nr:L,D-transpeptidase [Polyangiaceae bacterium]
MRHSHPSRTRAWLGVTAALALAAATGCRSKDDAGKSEGGIFSMKDAPALAKSADAEGGVTLPETPETMPREGGPKIGAAEYVAPIYSEPDPRSDKLGYLRAGGTLVRAEQPVRKDDCAGGWYRVAPLGFMCATKEATTDMEHPIIRALTLRPDLSKPMPYPYAFVRAVAPNYYRVPTKAEQFQFEMALDRHLRSYKRLHDKWDVLEVGANDITLDAEGNAIGVPPDEAPPLDYNKFYGGNGSDAIPWYFDGGRKLPNIASFKVPDYAVITNRVKRKAMLALIGTFVGPNDRRFAMTTDARLVPTSKLKPDTGPVFHGVDLQTGWNLPVAFVKLEGSYGYDLSKAALDKKEKIAKHEAVPLTGRSRSLGGYRMLEATDGTWYREHDLAIAAKPSKLPSFAKADKRWIDISIQAQTLVLYEGQKAVYATAVSTGRDGLGDPQKTLSTPTGVFQIREKHVTTTMDAHEVDNQFELRDVPWVQYFKGGYALHAAPWHDDFGKPRSHGCVNLAPIDARRVFMFTDPKLPKDWHGVNASPKTAEGTVVYIHP